MSLPKLFFIILLTCFFSLFCVSPVLADCNITECTCAEGTCPAGAVYRCVGCGGVGGAPIKTCNGSSWDLTPGATLNGAGCIITSWLPGSSSLIKFQTTVIHERITGVQSKTRWTGDTDDGAVTDITNSLTTNLVGYQPAALQAAGINPKEFYANNKNQSALALLGQGIGSMYRQPPSSSIEYLADLGSSLGLVSPVYAQGTGWQALSPVLKVWKGFRNVAYLFLVIIFIIIGFMIMFRAKINPQTVVSVQDALPKIIVTLLLITFSYAIAGLMIDLIYILIYLIVGVFELGGLITNAGVVADRFLSLNLWQIIYSGKGWGRIVTGPAQAVDDMIVGFFGGNTEEGALAQILGWLGGNAIFSVILGAALVFVTFRVWISLLMAYIGIIVSVVLAPINLLFNALPGNNSFGNWIKGLLANILPFPVIALMFLLSAVLIGIPQGTSSDCDEAANPWCVQEGIGFLAQGENQAIWVPPFMPMTGGAGALSAMVALGIIMMMPKAVEMIKKALKVEEGAMAAGLPAIIGGIASPIKTFQAYKGYRQEKLSKEFTRRQVEEMRSRQRFT